jgi:hypothetical protein
MNKSFGGICLVLAILFSVAAVMGLMSGAGFVLIMPALVAVSLVMVGIYNFKKGV